METATAAFLKERTSMAEIQDLQSNHFFSRFLTIIIILPQTSQIIYPSLRMHAAMFYSE